MLTSWSRKVATLEDATEQVNLRDALDAGECVVQEWRPMNMHSFTWSPYLNHEWDESPGQSEPKRLQELAKRISTVPEGSMQSRVAKIYGDRQAMAAGEKLFDWGGAKTSPTPRWLMKVFRCVCPVKTPGADLLPPSRVIHNQTNGSTYTPLQHVHNGQGHFKSGTPCCLKKRYV
jgi:2-oxoglutarate dehydrogenase E1 component